jgi:hypothetical protein
MTVIVVAMDATHAIKIAIIVIAVILIAQIVQHVILALI